MNKTPKAPCAGYKPAFALVMEQIAIAKAHAIATQTRMIKKRDICRRAGVCHSYFTSVNPSSQEAFNAYADAAEEAALTATNVPKKRKYVSVKQQREPRLRHSPKTTARKFQDDSRDELQRKERQLLAHLDRFTKVPVRSLPYKLDLSESAVGAMVQRLIQQGVVKVECSPFDENGKYAAIVLANQQQKAS